MEHKFRKGPEYYLRTSNDRLPRVWKLQSEPIDVNLCSMAAAGQLPLALGAEGATPTAATIAVDYKIAEFDVGEMTYSVSIFLWTTELGATETATVRVIDVRGDSSWSGLDPGPRPAGTPYILPITIDDVAYLVVITWSIQIGSGEVRSTTGVDRLATPSAAELWRVLTPDATAVVATKSGETFTRRLPP